ncbi:MAG: hypothetical protein LBU11_10835 [Zoogloeaceae bacterium]|nr:hypothetical protein [Zoogloeaceae bacterium]
MFYITHEGRGLYALLPIFTGYASSGLLEASLDLERLLPHNTGAPHPYSMLAFSAGVLLGAFIIRWMGRHNKKERILVDPETQETFRFAPKDTLYGVSLNSWSIVWMVIACLGASSTLHELFSG